MKQGTTWTVHRRRKSLGCGLSSSSSLLEFLKMLLVVSVPLLVLQTRQHRYHVTWDDDADRYGDAAVIISMVGTGLLG